MTDKAKLRGHHLICLNFFEGEGYSAEFVENLKYTLEKATSNGIMIVDGADDVCSSCPYLKDGKCSYEEGAEEEIQRLDRLALELLHLQPGESTEFKSIIRNLPPVLPQWQRKACLECEWRRVCEEKWRNLT